MSYPDGSKYVYGFVVTNSSGVFQNAFMTEQWNAVGQNSRLNYSSYDPATPVIHLKEVIDGDGRTNSTYSANLISQVTDPFNRSASFQYDVIGQLTNITDVAGLTSSFGYDTNGWVTTMTTPYGTTSFKITDYVPGAIIPNGRAVEITEPGGSKQLYLTFWR